MSDTVTNEQTSKTNTPKEGGTDANPKNEVDRDALLAELAKFIREQNAQVQNSQEAIDEQRKLLELLQADLKAQTKSSEDIGKAGEEYAKQFNELCKRFDDLVEYEATKRRAILAGLDPKRKKYIKEIYQQIGGAVEGEPGNYVGEVGDLEKRIAELEKKYKLQLVNEKDNPIEESESRQFANISHENALSGPDGKTQREKSYNELIGRAKKLKEWLDAADALKKLIEKKEDEGKTEQMFVLVKDLHALLEKIKKYLIDPDVFSSELDQAWTKLFEAQIALSEQKNTLDVRTAELEAKKKQLDEATKNRWETIFKLLLVPPPEDGSGNGGGGAAQGTESVQTSTQAPTQTSTQTSAQTSAP